MYLVTPSCLVLALLVRRLGDTKMAADWQLGGVLVICSLLLVSFYQQYFLVFWQTGGLAHRTFRTGPVEPKQAAFQYIRAAAADELTLTVLAEDWWTYCPLLYLSQGRPGMQLRALGEAGEEQGSRRRFVVGFAGGPLERWLSAHVPDRPNVAFNNYAGRPMLRVWDLGTSPDLASQLLAAVPPELSH